MFVTSNQLDQLLPYYKEKLNQLYEASEIEQMFFLMAFFVFGLEKIEVRTREILLSESQLLDQRNIVKRLQLGEPIQYVLEKAEFYDLILEVSPAVLIPRPETAELVDFILTNHTSKKLHIIDIGTGSGCIPLALKSARQHWNISAIDVSKSALALAKKNGDKLNLEVNWVQENILTAPLPDKVKYDIIISNPPYVLESDKKEMHANVLNHEPSLALFVPNTDPLLFYDRIIKLAQTGLKKAGMLYFEIHEKYGAEIIQSMKNNHFIDCKIIKDLSGKDRFTSGKLA